MYGCADWCADSMGGFKGIIRVPRTVSMFCGEEIFHTTREEYGELLRKRNDGLLSNQQIREDLLKKATVKIKKHHVCADGLYCATVPQPMIEALIVTQEYRFKTGAKPFTIPNQAPVPA